MIFNHLRSLTRRVTWHTTPKPILRSSLKLKTKKTIKSFNKSGNHHWPGCVYIFEDINTRRGLGITLCKIGLSRTPLIRRYYLSREYDSELQVRAIVPTVNMKMTEEFMHVVFNKHHELRTQGLDGYTEWFRTNWLRIKLMQITLFAIATVVSVTHLAIISVVLTLAFTLFL